MQTEVLFTPFVTVTVEAGKVVGTQIDWADTYQNAFAAGVEVEGATDLNNSDVKTACEFLDNSELRARVNAAIKL